MREPDRIVRLKTVLARTGLSRSTIYRKIAEGTFPAQLKISVNGTGWHESEVNRWITDRPRGVRNVSAMRSDKAGTVCAAYRKFAVRGVPHRKQLPSSVSRTRRSFSFTRENLRHASISKVQLSLGTCGEDKRESPDFGRENDQFVRAMKLPNGREWTVPDDDQKI
jgi:prophage regulatory protein